MEIDGQLVLQEMPLRANPRAQLVSHNWLATAKKPNNSNKKEAFIDTGQVPGTPAR